MFGCPFANFAQYIFLDFETGTTIDNAYAITGIKHTITPGKFTTSLTLSYGDVYGKYESTASTLAREISDREKEINKDNDKKQNNKKEKEKTNVKEVKVREILSFIKTPDYRNLKPFSEKDNALVDNKFIPIKLQIKDFKNDEVILAKEIKFVPRIKTYLSDRNIVTIDRINTKKPELEVNVRHFLYEVSLNETRTETIESTLNVLEDKSVKKVYDDYIAEVKSNIIGNTNVDILQNVLTNNDNIFKIKDNKVDIFDLTYNFLFKNINALILDLIKEFTEINLKYSVNVSDQKISNASLEKEFNLNFDGRFNNQTEQIAKFLKNQFQTNLKQINSLEVTKEQILTDHNSFINENEKSLLETKNKLRKAASNEEKTDLQIEIQDLEFLINDAKKKSQKDIIRDSIESNNSVFIEKEAFRSKFSSIEINDDQIEFRYSRYYKIFTPKQKRVLVDPLKGLGVYDPQKKTYTVPSNYSGQYLIPSKLETFYVASHIKKDEVHIVKIKDFMEPMIKAIKTII